MAIGAGAHLPNMPLPGDSFVSLNHKLIPDNLSPEKSQLPKPYTACVVGASRGIGAHTAFAYAKAGATTIFLAARSTDQLSATAAEIQSLNPSTKVHTVPCDVTSSASVAELAARIRAEDGGRLDAVVFNSGYHGPEIVPMTEADPDVFEMGFKVNAVGTFLAAKYLVPLLIASEAGMRAFVVVSTAAPWINFPGSAGGYAAYGTSKMAQIRLVEKLVLENKEKGLFGASVHPGMVSTEMSKDAGDDIRPFLSDDVGLCGAFIVWLTRDTQKTAWLNGRWLSSKWDVDGLEANRELVEKDDSLLKTGLTGI